VLVEIAYGGQFMSRLYSEAFFESDPHRLVEAALDRNQKWDYTGYDWPGAFWAGIELKDKPQVFIILVRGVKNGPSI